MLMAYTLTGTGPQRSELTQLTVGTPRDFLNYL